MSVGVNPPKTPVTKGSNGIAAATLPNICKMPGPPAPFVPTPLPNIGKSGEKPDGYTQNVKVEGKTVAIKGASFGSMGDIASKGTGGGLVSANTHGPCKFIGPGSMDVKFEGKNVHLLSDPMTNNGGGSGSPANSATMVGLLQAAEAKNPSNKDVCGAGNHSEIIEYPEVPPGEEDVNKRVEAMKRAGANDHEINAAKHDIAKGDITHGKQLSRGRTPEEKVAGTKPHEQMIWAICTECGYRREIDQSPNEKATVEAKDLKTGWGDKGQKLNNIKLAKDGTRVTYKLKELKARGQIGREIWQSFKAAGAHLVKIIPI